MEFVDLKAQRRHLGSRIDDAIGRVLSHAGFIQGPEVAEFERALASFVGANNCVSCANGTDALVLALRAMRVAPGDGVIVPSFTFAATAEAVVLAGGVPVFADIDPVSFNIDPKSVAEVLSISEMSGTRVAGVIAVDLFGHPADYGALRDVIGGRWLVADAAQSLGAERDRARVGTLATVTTTSFFPAKPLGCYGDGGAVFTDDDAVADVLRSLRSHGQGTDKYDNVRVGTNSRLDTIQAAILLVKLDAFPAELTERQRVADSYVQLLGDSNIETPIVETNCQSAWAQFTVRCPNRDEVAAVLRESGIPTAVYYRLPLHKSRAYGSFCDYELPATLDASTQVLSLPMGPYLASDDVARVTEALQRASAKSG